MSILIDTAKTPTRILRSWGSGADDWVELPVGADVVQVDGPGTSHPRAYHGEDMYHDEYVWLPRIEHDNFRCTFVLELEEDVQGGLRSDVGRHGGFILGASKPYANVFWPNCPRNRNDNLSGGCDGAWIGYSPDGSICGRVFGEPVKTVAAHSRPSVPSQWVVEVYQTNLQVTIDDVKVVDCDAGKTMDGFLGLWRARSGHRVIAHNLVVERSETHILQAGYDGKVIQFTLLNGETICEIEVGADEKLHDVRTQLAAKLQATYSSFRVILPSGELLSNVLEKDPDAVVSVHFS